MQRIHLGLGLAEDADLEVRPLDHLTERITAEFAVDVIDADQRLGRD